MIIRAINGAESNIFYALLLISTNRCTLSMKLSQWAKQKNIHYNTALKWHKAGKIPNSYELNGSIMVDEEDYKNNDKFMEKLEKIENLLSIIVSKMNEKV